MPCSGESMWTKWQKARQQKQLTRVLSTARPQVRAQNTQVGHEHCGMRMNSYISSQDANTVLAITGHFCCHQAGHFC